MSVTSKVAFIDSETTGVQNLFNQTPREQFRLGQWAWGRDGEVQVTTDYEEFRSVVESAHLIVGHNIFYDTTVLWGRDSIRPLELALDKRVLDTFSWFPLRNRVPQFYTTREGRNATTYREGKQKPELINRYLALDNLTFQLGLPGKLGNLVELAKKYNPEGTLKADLDFGLVPTDDPDFIEYAKQDIVALQALASHLMDQGPITNYEWREMLVTAINDQMTKNGFRLDVTTAQARVTELQEQKESIMGWLVDEFDFPTEGKAPWKSDAGKEAILRAFESFGVSHKSDEWTKTPKGTPSFSKETLVAVAEGTGAEPLAEAVGTLQGQRSLAEQALESSWNDGYVHPQVSALQRSGRLSVTKPSLPIWTARGKGAVEKSYFIASPGGKLVEMDLSNADQRIVAALSGDPEYAKRFEGDADGHEITGRLMFGDEAYEAEMPEGWQNSDELRKANPSRQVAKALSHAFAYGAGAKTLARTARKDKATANLSDDELLDMANLFVATMNKNYPWNKTWREKVAEEGRSGWVTNSWGRRMPVDVDRSWTQSPGLHGQSGTREILFDGLIRIARDRIEVMRWLVASVHDALVWDIPEGDLEWAVPYIVSKMETMYDPKTNVSQPIWFPMGVGEPADNWFEANHG